MNQNEIRWSDQLLVAPLAEPVHLTEARTHIGEPSGTSRDERIKRAIRAARRHVENYCSRALVRQQRKLTLDDFPEEGIVLPVGPLRAVQSVQYVDEDGATQTLATTEYRIDRASERARITLEYDKDWPTLRSGVTNRVIVTYTAGHVVPISSFDGTGDAITAKGHDLAADDPVRLSNSGGGMQSGLSLDENYYVKAPTTDTLQLALSAGGAAVDITTTTTATGNNFVGVVPDELVSAMLLIVGQLMERVEENSDFQVFEMPFAMKNLLAFYDLKRFC